MPLSVPAGLHTIGLVFYNQHHVPTTINCLHCLGDKTPRFKTRCLASSAAASSRVAMIQENSRKCRTFFHVPQIVKLGVEYGQASITSCDILPRYLSCNKVKHHRYPFRHRLGIHVGLARARLFRPSADPRKSIS